MSGDAPSDELRPDCRRVRGLVQFIHTPFDQRRPEEAKREVGEAVMRWQQQLERHSEAARAFTARLRSEHGATCGIRYGQPWRALAKAPYRLEDMR